jgi:hypothetical protein
MLAENSLRKIRNSELLFQLLGFLFSGFGAGLGFKTGYFGAPPAVERSSIATEIGLRRQRKEGANYPTIARSRRR